MSWLCGVHLTTEANNSNCKFLCKWLFLRRSKIPNFSVMYEIVLHAIFDTVLPWQAMTFISSHVAKFWN